MPSDSMKSIQISHRYGSYEVRFESIDSAIERLPSDLRIITDTNVVQHFGPLLEAKAPVVMIDPGEQSKSLKSYGSLLSWLAKTKASRKTMICALGGGVVGDLAGFVAATYMRGVPFYQIPTSLLAQVDSSVGGKVGVDLVEGKNLAGAFYPPSGVSIDVAVLKTLPVNQFVNGMAEVWKYAFIMDAGLTEPLAAEGWGVEHPALGEVVRRCIALKAEVVQGDEFETLGLRAILNFGHTIGHAVEYAVGYGNILHGEAISIGMVVEARLGEMLGMTRMGVTQEVSQYLANQGLPTTHSILKNERALLSAMYGDKKAAGGNLAFSLLSDIGRCKLVESVPEATVLAAMRES